MRNLWLLVISATILLPLAVQAQFQIGMNFVQNYALHQYSRNIEQNPAGISFTGIYRIPSSKFSIGFDWGASMYASDHFTKELSQEGFPKAYADVSQENCYMSYQLLARYAPIEYKILSPYGEVRMGGASFFTERVYHEPFVEDPDVDKPEHVEDFFQWDGTAFQVAAGGGMIFDLNQWNETHIPLSFDFNFNYVVGSKANYRSLSEPPVPTQDNSRMYNSSTNSYAWRLGVFYSFGE